MLAAVKGGVVASHKQESQRLRGNVPSPHFDTTRRKRKKQKKSKRRKGYVLLFLLPGLAMTVATEVKKMLVDL